MKTVKNWLAGLDLLEIARGLLLFELVALQVSTSLAVGTEFIIYLLFAHLYYIVVICQVFGYNQAQLGLGT